MSIGLLVVFSLAIFLAYVNGSNDVSKGIATLVGSGVTTCPHAIVWGTLWTGAGAIASVFLARAMVITFGSGLLANGASPTFAAAIAAIAGAASWVMIATRAGLPVSTTHAIAGSIAAVGAMAYGWNGVNWAAFGGKIAAPLLISPIASLALTAVLLRAWPSLAGTADNCTDCVCMEAEPAAQFSLAAPAEAAIVIPGPPNVRIFTGTQQVCTTTRPFAIRLTMNHLHWFTSGATSFSRGLNDAPKMVALVLAAAVLPSGARTMMPAVFAVVALGMVAGSLIAGRRVTAVLAEKVTRMDHREGFVANLVTAALIGSGAALGLPMSTTHVSSGAIIGAGISKEMGVNRGTVRDMVLAWMITLPAAALLGALAYDLLRVGGLA
jgi:PiT family inorganic phosphate transporter